MNLEKSYSYFSDYLFMNFLNTVNNKKGQMTELLADEVMVENWMDFMEEKEMLSSYQVEKVREGSIHAADLQAFRDEIRSYFMDQRSSSHIKDLLEQKIKKVPLYFKVSSNSFRPIPYQGGGEGLISLLAYSILDAYRTGVWSKVKKCENSSCVALFIDKKGKRKWCSMRVCGNRVKAQKYYTKKQGSSME